MQDVNSFLDSSVPYILFPKFEILQIFQYYCTVRCYYFPEPRVRRGMVESPGLRVGLHRWRG